MKQFIKKIFGIDKIEQATAEAVAAKLLAEAEAIAAKATAELEIANAQKEKSKAEEAERIAKLTPKERATLKGEAWVSVLDTHVNKDNIKNGFFELDWNEEFILQLKQAGYGFEGDPDEQIVDRWFRDLATNMLVEDGQSPNRGAGYINIQKLPGGRAAVE
jgi:hypothetical protein